MQADKFTRVSLQPVFGAPTVVALLWILGQHHGHPQADPGGTARDQHYLLPGTRHDNPAGSQSVCHLTTKLRQLEDQGVGHTGHMDDQITDQPGSLCALILMDLIVFAFSFIYLILGHNYRCFLKPPSKYSFGQLFVKIEKAGFKNRPDCCPFWRDMAPPSGQH